MCSQSTFHGTHEVITTLAFGLGALAGASWPLPGASTLSVSDSPRPPPASSTHRATIAHRRPYTSTHVHACRQLAVTACVEVGTSTLVPPLPHHRNDRAGNHDCMRLCSSSTHLLVISFVFTNCLYFIFSCMTSIVRVAPSHFTPNPLLTRPASTATMTTHHRITSIECESSRLCILDAPRLRVTATVDYASLSRVSSSHDHMR